jgi:hypothetical protein
LTQLLTASNPAFMRMARPAAGKKGERRAPQVRVALLSKLLEDCGSLHSRKEYCITIWAAQKDIIKIRSFAFWQLFSLLTGE